MRPPSTGMTTRDAPAFAVCRCGHWETDHDLVTGICAHCPNPAHRYVFYEYRAEAP